MPTPWYTQLGLGGAMLLTGTLALSPVGGGGQLGLRRVGRF